MENDKMKKVNIVYNSSLAMFKNMLSGVINGTCDLDINTFLHINVSMQNCVSSSEELIEVLKGLGYKQADIVKVLPKVNSNETLEQQIKEALKLLLKS